MEEATKGMWVSTSVIIQEGNKMSEILLTKDNFQLVKYVIKWIETVRKSKDYSDDWLPNEIDAMKSRLFWRIRTGKDPLPEPPPRAYSCPWYEVIEQDRPHWANDLHDLKSFREAFHLKQEPDKLSICQCLYDIVEFDEKQRGIVKFGNYEFDIWKESRMVINSDQTHEQEFNGWWIQLRSEVTTNE